MKIIADDKIPYLKGVLEPFSEVEYLPGNRITKAEVKSADALLLRTRTCCDAGLLEGSQVKFIGTATIGFDHIDVNYCEERGIVWRNAPGCNAASVNQYVSSALVYLSRRYGFSLRNRALGVVGVGNVGTKVVSTAELLGMQVYLCDPPRVRTEGICGFISLDGIIRECDIITFHVPLNKEGTDCTYQMINKDMLKKILPGTIIINTSRGEVADGNALKQALDKKKLTGLVLDVWESEPRIDQDLLDRCTIGTPHIAGYSADGKAKGTSIIVRELSRFFNLGLDDWEPTSIPAHQDMMITVDCLDREEEDIIAQAITSTYRVEDDDRRLRAAPSEFEKQRGNYPLRREFKAYTLNLTNGWPEIKRTFRKLGFKVR
jgi:erythronate-4-phosphate dehydrogenase